MCPKRKKEGGGTMNNVKYAYGNKNANGNLIYVNTSREKQDGTNDSGSGERKLVWDEENRLQSVYTNGFISGYWYDAAGERVIKTSGDDEGIYVNDVFSGARTFTDNFTAYINPYLVVSKGGSYTKHIYIGSQRIVSKLGDLDSYGNDPRRIEYAGSNVDGAKVDYKAKYKASQQAIRDNYAAFEVPYYGTDNDDYVNGQSFCCDDTPKLKSFDSSKNDNPELYQYYYHSDHLGSSSLITNLDGEIVQHVEYVPFGEVFIEERNNTWNTPYLFYAKELDEETGLYYYGARYYDARTSVWLSADPLQEDFPNISSYAYVGNNPVKFVDLKGDSLIYHGDAQAVADLHNNHLGGYYNVTVNPTTDEVSMSAVSGKNPDNMTRSQREYYNKLNIVINGSGTTTINVVQNSEGILIGELASATIDVGDMAKLPNGTGSFAPINSASTLIHEIWEQYQVQVIPSSLVAPGTSNTDAVAHIRATNNAEARVLGVGVDFNRTPISTSPDAGYMIRR
jgi:RHS repeat-associated protein